MKSATPSPHDPLRTRARAMILRPHPPATGMPFNGRTMNSETTLGTRAPIRSARNQYTRPRALLSDGQIAAPQIPPQTASEITAGTPSGAVLVMSYGTREIAPESHSSVSTPWWNTSVDRNPAMKAPALLASGVARGFTPGRIVRRSLLGDVFSCIRDTAVSMCNRRACHDVARRNLCLEEPQQICVDLILERRAQAVRRALVDLETRVLDQLGGEHGGGGNRDDLIVVAVDDERRDVELLQILGEVRLGERLDAVEHPFVAGLHALEPERVTEALGDLGARPIGAVERRSQIFEELRAVGEDVGPDLVERLHRQPAGIGGRSQHQRRHRADEDGLRHSLRAVTSEVARNLAAARGVADVDRVIQVERPDQHGEIVRVGVHLVAGPGLARAALAATVVCDAPVGAR